MQFLQIFISSATVECNTSTYSISRVRQSARVLWVGYIQTNSLKLIKTYLLTLRSRLRRQQQPINQLFNVTLITPGGVAGNKSRE